MLVFGIGGTTSLAGALVSFTVGDALLLHLYIRTIRLV